jgi:hypothetical protein
MAMYMKMGLLPGYPIFSFLGAPKLTAPTGDARVVELAPDEAATLDAWPGREPDHAAWAPSGRKVIRAGQTAGYSHARSGLIGPARWTAPEHAEAVLTLALDEARSQADQVRLAVPGINHAAIHTALGAGLHLLAHATLLHSGDLGAAASYIPSGPILFCGSPQLRVGHA